MTSTVPHGTLVGRDREVAQLADLVAEVATGRGRSVWVEGEPGIGKSALLAAGLADATRLGCEVFWEAADEARQRFPLWVLLDCLRVGSRSPDQARAEIAALLRGERAAGLTPGDGVAVVSERLLALVDRLCAASPVVLVVDDLHWADDASLALWRRLHETVGQLPLLLVGAGWPVPARPEVAELRAAVAGDAVTIELAPLTGEEAVELAGRLAGGHAGPRLRTQVGRTGGNPLYVRELVDALRRDRAVRVGGGTAELVGPGARRPVSLAGAIARRLGFVSERTTGVLRMAALLGAEFPLAHLRIVTGQPADVLAAAVREAVAAGVLAEPSAGTPGGDRLAFRHELIRQALYDGMPAQVRSGLHRHAAQALAEAADVPVERIAEHLLAAAQPVDAWVVGWVAGATPVLIYRAPRIAVDLLERVRASTGPGGARREPLDTCLVTALFLLGRDEDTERLARAVLAGTRDPAVAGRMTWVLGYVLLRTVRHEEALAVTADTAALDPVWAARVLALRAMVYTQLGGGRPDDVRVTAGEAVTEGERAGDPVAVGYALHALSLVISRYDRDPAAMLAVVDRALDVVGDQPEAADLRLLLLANRFAALDNLGRPADAERVIGEATALAERTGNQHRQAQIRLHATEHAYLAGRWDDALAELDAVGDLVPSVPPWSLIRHGVAGLVAAHRDERPTLDAHLAALAGLDVTAPALRGYALQVVGAQALAAERDGRPAEALAALLALLDLDSAGVGGLGEDSHLWQPDVVRLAQAAGDEGAARAATEGCLAEARQTPTPGRLASAEHCRGLHAGDPALVLAAADAYERLVMPLHRAQALEDAAVLLARRDDPAAAHAAYTGAVEIYTRLGAAWDVLRADSRLRALGVRRGSRGPRRRPPTGWEALTPTEVRIAELVAAGRSNPDIAGDLLLSRRTVQSHVSHILAKLGAQSRVGIARELARRQRGGYQS